MLSLKGFSVQYTLLRNVLYLVVNYPLSYTWLKHEPQISIRKERFVIIIIIIIIIIINDLFQFGL